MARGWLEARSRCWVLLERLARKQHAVVGVGSSAGFLIDAISAPYQKIPGKLDAFCLECSRSCS